MPELPDVELFRKYLESTSLRQRIDRVDAFDDRILEDISPKALHDALVGHRFDSTMRHGKYLFTRHAEDRWLVLHFGMTGYLQYLDEEKDLPSHTRVVFSFENGKSLAFVCQRMLGHVAVTEDPEEYVRARELGGDALEMSRAEFVAALGGRHGSIKSALTNQSIIAGLGNIYADEVLYQAKVRPDSRLRDLDEDDLAGIYDRMHEVVDRAVDSEVNVSRMPDTWLLPHRREGEPCPRCGAAIEVRKMSGRTAYFCPSCQPER